MFRFSLIVCVSLIFGITAKPWNKVKEEAFQDTVTSVDDKGKLSWGVEVEPPEDMDETQYIIDPRMMIWKSRVGQDKQPLKAEEDLDELHHPSMADLLKVQVQNMDVLSAFEMQRDLKEKNRKEPEQDMDEVFHKDIEQLDEHLAQQVPRYESGAEEHVSYTEAEKDEDDLYHPDEQLLPVQVEPVAIVESEARVHLEPEEDLDDLYHQDLLLPVVYKGDTKAFDIIYDVKHSEPEEDLDDIYHHL